MLVPLEKISSFYPPAFINEKVFPDPSVASTFILLAFAFEEPFITRYVRHYDRWS